MSVQLLIVPGVKLGKRTCVLPVPVSMLLLQYLVKSPQPLIFQTDFICQSVSGMLLSIMRTLSSMKTKLQLTVMETMQDQWSELAKPGYKVKVKIKDELANQAIIDKL